MLYKTVQPTDLFHDLKAMGRNGTYSFEGAQAPMEFLEECYDGECKEYDPIAYCCEFIEYHTLAAFNKDYSADYKTWDDVEEKTVVIRFGDDSAIVQAF